MTDTSWEKSSIWYNKIVGEDGQYYHQRIVIPGVMKMMDLKNGDSVLDLGCGQGILGRNIEDGTEYLGIDLSASLIETAKRMDRKENHVYKVGDATKKLPSNKTDFSHAAIILALQNMADAQGALLNASNHLKDGGKLIIVLNHPVFRIPRLTAWGVDKENKIQYRRINKYLTPQKISILTNPGKENSETTWSFHRPLGEYSQMIYKAGMMIEWIEEWVSDKTSEGGAAKMENAARAEFPLFMAILCSKQ